MSIKQLSASYVADEDRVLFRFTTDRLEEYRLWLTRAVVGQLLVQLKGAAVQVVKQTGQVTQAESVAEFKQQAVEQNANFTSFEPAPRLPLGAEPVLVKAVLVSCTPPNNHLRLDLAGGKQLGLPMGEDLVAKMRLLLQKMAVTARWALDPEPVPEPSSPPSPDGLTAPPPGTKTLH